MKTNKSGISLIVLVITIIVLALLAAAVIITITNVGLINAAGDSVDQHELSQIRDVAAVAWMEAVLDSDITTDEEYIEYITTYLKGAGYTDKILSNYTITADVNSVTVNPKRETSDEGNDSGNEPPEISLTLDKTEIGKEITVGSSETETLVATLTNATGNLTWTTSDNTVVEVVGNGETATLTFVGEGTAIITVSYGDGVITAICEVSVTEKEEVEKISFKIVTPTEEIILYAEKNMSWDEWMASSTYNTIGVYKVTGYINGENYDIVYYYSLSNYVGGHYCDGEGLSDDGCVPTLSSDILVDSGDKPWATVPDNGTILYYTSKL